MLFFTTETWNILLNLTYHFLISYYIYDDFFILCYIDGMTDIKKIITWEKTQWEKLHDYFKVLGDMTSHETFVNLSWETVYFTTYHWWLTLTTKDTFLILTDRRKEHQ